MSYVKGDIIWVPDYKRTKRMLKHAAILWDESYNGTGSFSGIMITHSPPSDRFENILMNIKHFENGHSFGFENSHFVNQLFMKFEEWGPISLYGKLTQEGIEYITENLTNTDLKLYEIYNNR